MGGAYGGTLGAGFGALIGNRIGNAIVHALNSDNSSSEGAPTTDGKSVPSAPTMGAAQREGMRDQGIPTSQQPASQKNTAAGKQYTYVVPKPGGGTETKIAQRNTGTDRSHSGQPHVEVGRPKANGATDSIGRPRLDSNKTKVNVKTTNGQ